MLEHCIQTMEAAGAKVLCRKQHRKFEGLNVSVAHISKRSLIKDEAGKVRERRGG